MILPIRPHFVCNRYLVPLVSRSGEDVLRQCGACCDGCEPFFGYQEQRTRCLFLDIFETVDVFRHPWIFYPPLRHSLLEGHDVSIFESPAVRYEVVCYILGGGGGLF